MAFALQFNVENKWSEKMKNFKSLSKSKYIAINIIIICSMCATHLQAESLGLARSPSSADICVEMFIDQVKTSTEIPQVKYLDKATGVSVTAEPPNLMQTLGGLFSNPFKSIKKYNAKRDAYNLAVQAQVVLQKEITDGEFNIKTLQGNLQRTFGFIRTGFTEIISEANRNLTAAKTADEAKSIVLDFVRKYQAETAKVKDFTDARTSHKTAVLADLSRLEGVEPNTGIRELSENVLAQIATSESPGEIKALSLGFQNDALAKTNSVRDARLQREAEERQQRLAAEKKRRAQERRFDLDAKGNSNEILTAGIEVYSKIISVPDIAKIQIAQAMELSPELKKFVYRSMQVARIELALIKKSEADDKSPGLEMRKLRTESAREGLKLRVGTDLKLILEAVATKNLDKLKISENTRLAIRHINRPDIFDGLVTKGSKLARKLNSEEREMILQDALKAPELAFSLRAAGGALPHLRPMPTLPKEPSREPKLPARPEYSESRARTDAAYGQRKKREFAAYKTEAETVVSRWKQSWSDYKTAAERVKIDLANYKQEVLIYHKAQLSRKAFRSQVLSYLSTKLPDSVLIGGAQVRFISRVKAQRMDSQLSPGLRKRIADQSQLGPEFMDWYMMIYTQNPMWLINRDVALFQLLFSNLFNYTDYLRTSSLAEIPESGAGSAPQIDIDELARLQNQSLGLSAAVIEAKDNTVPIDPNAEVSPDNLNTDIARVEADIADADAIPATAETSPDLPNLPNLPDTTSTPDMNGSGTGGIDIPKIDIPDINIPDIVIPEINIPDVVIPEINIPVVVIMAV